MSKQEDYYIHCGIKKKWHSKTLDDFDNDLDALRCVKRYVSKASQMRKKGIGLFLWGSNGTGKSHLMNCAFKELLQDSQVTVRVYTLDEIVEKTTSAWYSDGDKQELNHMLRHTTFLGIDEFGKNMDANGNPIKLPDLVKRIMESTIRYRVQMQLPIWITSNTDPKYVKDVFSEDIASLLNEAVVPVCVRGDDCRKLIQAKIAREVQQ